MCKWWTTLRWKDIEKMYRRFKTAISYAVSPFLHRTRLCVSHLERLCFWDDEADLNLCRFETVSAARKRFAVDVPRFIMQLQLMLCLVESEISPAVVSNQKNHISRRSGMLLVSHLGRHFMVHSHGFNIDDTVSGDPQIDFFHSRHEDARSTSFEFQFLRARLRRRIFWGQVVQTQRMDSATLWFGRFSGEIDSPPRSKSLPQYHSLVTSWNVVYFEVQILTKIYRGWLSNMATNQNRVGSGPSLQKRNVVRNLWTKKRKPRHHHHHQRVQKHLNHDTFWIFRLISNF